MKLQSALLTFATVVMSAPAVAGALSSFPEVTSDPGGSGGNAGLVILLVIGALILMNGANGINRSQAKSPAQPDADDDDIIMKF